MKPSYILLLLFLLLNVPALSQKRDQFHIEQFNTENGLPSNGIKGLQWDEQTGFLWIATEAGVVRYNGIEFKTFTKDDESHITNERIVFMVRNNAGRIYFADFTGNVFHVKENRLIYQEKQVVYNNPHSKLFSIAVSELLYSSKNDFADIGSFFLQIDKPLPVGDTACLALHNEKLFYYDLNTMLPVQVSPTNMHLSVGFKIGGNFFVRDGQKSVYLFDVPTRRFIPVEMVDEQTGVGLNDPDNTFLWENGRDKPVMFDKGNAWTLNYYAGKLRAHLICDSVPEDVSKRFALYDENRKKLFIGTDSKGLIVISANKVESLKLASKQPNQTSSYYAQVELPGGNILTSPGHIIGRNTAIAGKLPINGHFGNSVFLVGDSLLWYAFLDQPYKAGRLQYFNYHTGETKVFERIRLPSEFALGATLGNVYVANERGIFLIQGDTLYNVYHHPADGFWRIHYDMIEIDPGVFALATCNALLRFDTKTRKMDTLLKAGNYCVRAVWKYNDYLFIGTYGGGLFLYKKGKAKALPLDKNKYLLHTHCFVKDQEGYCWISTNKGLFKARLSEMIESFYSNTSFVYYYYFGRNDGMQMTELNGGCVPCAIARQDKTISFPSMDGLLWVNPATAQPDLPVGKIYIDQFIVDGKEMNLDSNNLQKLSQNTNEIIVKLGLSAWCNKENIYVDYRLNNETIWKPLNIDQGFEVRFDNLPQGAYTLHLRKRNGFGSGDYSYNEIQFDIRIPWYKQWWFYLLIGIGIIGLIALYLKFRTRQYVIRQRKLEQQVSEKTRELKEKNAVLEKNDTIKTRLISIISHDIITPLKFLTVAGKNLLEKKQLMNEELQQETIREMTGTSQELQLLSTNILNWIKYQNENRRMGKETFNVREMVDQVLGILGSLAKQKKLRIENAVDNSLEIYQFYEPLKILVYNLLTNAIHFTEKGSIVISAVKTNQDMIISVRDEGTGMTSDQIQNLMADEVVITSVNVDNKKGHGLGYLIIKDLVKTMGASLEIESKKETGTTVSVKMPALRTG